mmetsp:Transcript_73344/g.203532  ORF Transcript_73344/g.203532 Transcript_73344/m.203532 type:complete len:211 (+) Transcript_73344:301-933(+)
MPSLRPGGLQGRPRPTKRPDAAEKPLRAPRELRSFLRWEQAVQPNTWRCGRRHSLPRRRERERRGAGRSGFTRIQGLGAASHGTPVNTPIAARGHISSSARSIPRASGSNEVSAPPSPPDAPPPRFGPDGDLETPVLRKRCSTPACGYVIPFGIKTLVGPRQSHGCLRRLTQRLAYAHNATNAQVRELGPHETPWLNRPHCNSGAASVVL